MYVLVAQSGAVRRGGAAGNGIFEVSLATCRERNAPPSRIGGHAGRAPFSRRERKTARTETRMRCYEKEDTPIMKDMRGDKAMRERGVASVP